MSGLVKKWLDFLIKGIGSGWIHFHSYSNDEFLSKVVGVDTPYVLDIMLHMDKGTEEQAREVWYKTKKTFGTKFFFNRDGKVAVISYFPNEVKTNAELILRRPDDRFKFVKTPFTPSKAEFAGMALSHVMNRVREENAPPSGSSNK